MPDIDEATKQFVEAHRNDDVRTLALQAHRHPQVDMATAVCQIAGWQKARLKMPSWAEHNDIIYPPHLSLEQCSSDNTAQYKAQLCQRLICEYSEKSRGSILADMTGGMGVDFAALAPLFDKSIYIEQQHNLCTCAEHNFKILRLKGVEIMEADSTEALKTLPRTTTLFADPARRDTHGKRTFAIADCTPNILTNLAHTLDNTDFMMLKLSPMLDWRQAEKEINDACPKSVKEIHIVATANECKELLFVLSKKQMLKPTAICCSNDRQTFITDSDTEHHTPLPPTIKSDDEALLAKWIYEPNAAIMKAGCFHTLAQQFNMRALADNSHIFVSDSFVNGFPGRTLKVERVTTMNKRQLAEAMKDIKNANITTRNFNLKAQQLRKKLKIGDGGDIYLIATTTNDNTHIIFISRKG